MAISTERINKMAEGVMRLADSDITYKAGCGAGRAYAGLRDDGRILTIPAGGEGKLIYNAETTANGWSDGTHAIGETGVNRLDDTVHKAGEDAID